VNDRQMPADWIEQDMRGTKSDTAWAAIWGLSLLSAACILIGAGKILNLAFPLGAFAVGVLLYFRYPVLYVGFTWWIWFLTPLVRRLADYRSSFTNPSPMLLAPYLVTLITLVTLWYNLPKAYRQGSLLFVVSLLGIFYGFLTGLVQVSLFQACLALLDWLAPVVFGFHLYVNWPNYPRYRQNTLNVFVWAVLITGLYGVVQFLVAPEWDRFWMTQVGLSSVGKPEPFGIRVWSTANAPGPFANLMRAGLLLLFTSQSNLRLLASGAGYLSFLLTLVRSAWGSWFIGLLCLTSSLSTRLQVRLIFTILVMAMMVIPLVTIEPFAGAINERLETLSSIEDDKSANTRIETYNKLIGTALKTVLGQGIGSDRYDSAVLTILLNLGWVGTLPFIGGLLLLFFKLLQSPCLKTDTFASASQAIVFGSIAQLPLGSPMVELKGMLLWGFLGIGLAADAYHKQQRLIQTDSS
jgi:hypothetical protein